MVCSFLRLELAVIETSVCVFMCVQYVFVYVCVFVCIDMLGHTIFVPEIWESLYPTIILLFLQ